MDDHLSRVTARSHEALGVALEIAEARCSSYALVGGWAVFAYGSRIPSIDTDLMLGAAEAAVFRNALMARGMQDLEGPGRHVEILAMDEPNELHGFDWELGPVPAYTPRDILVGRCERRTIVTNGFAVQAQVPRAAELAFMKLKAMHDRSFDYRAVTDARAMARVNPSDRPLIARATPLHYVRKAGKDLADVAHLCTRCTDLETTLRVQPHLREHLWDGLRNVPEPVQRYASGLVSHSPDRAAWIARHVTTAT